MGEAKQVLRCEDSGTYQLRQEIPADLQEFVGKKEVKRSLDTSEEDTAKRRAADYAAEYEELFEKLRGDRGKVIDAGIISYLLYCLRDQV